MDPNDLNPRTVTYWPGALNSCGPQFLPAKGGEIFTTSLLLMDKMSPLGNGAWQRKPSVGVSRSPPGDFAGGLGRVTAWDPL
jgi:hypothetical protein